MISGENLPLLQIYTYIRIFPRRSNDKSRDVMAGELHFDDYFPCILLESGFLKTRRHLPRFSNFFHYVFTVKTHAHNDKMRRILWFEACEHYSFVFSFLIDFHSSSASPVVSLLYARLPFWYFADFVNIFISAHNTAFRHLQIFVYKRCLDILLFSRIGSWRSRVLSMPWMPPHFDIHSRHRRKKHDTHAARSSEIIINVKCRRRLASLRAQICNV